MEEAAFLNDTWSFFFHDPNDTCWSHDSYVRIADVGAVEEFWTVFDHVAPHAHEGIWFCFREHVFPCWDDPLNIKGGCLSIKVPKTEARALFEELCVRMLGESLATSEEHSALVNGVSISPKRSFCIIKIWVASPEAGDIKLFDLGGVAVDGDVFYKCNNESIAHNNIRITNAAAPAAAAAAR